ncbi:aminoacyl--tRNA ligase-related protein [Paenibacillus sp. HB172176]|uniref:aminoacyl--tRNA ligase-related protein n=1 Tax=Paenibacillus sp. HB172176 TaxID=2493690 RepID=UPI00143B6042|nr:aminoacyl--tRNA ligase-related protein [Paenibacillus sp. HB172176]
MGKLRLSCEGILTLNQAQSLMSKLAYSIEGIHECEWDQECMEIVIEPDDINNCDGILETVQAMIGEERGIRSLGSRTVNRISRRTGLPELGRRSDFERKLHHVFAADGSVKRDFAVRLVEMLDHQFQDMALRRGAALRKYPSMIALDTLEKCGYMRSFPQNLFLVGEFPHRYDVLRQIKAAPDPAALARQSRYALAPAVCFHCYEEMSGTTLNEPVLLTAMGSCFRHEAEWRVGNHRLSEFGMREIVFIGDSEFVEEERSWWMKEIWSWFSELGLAGSITTANDPFYFSEDALKIQHQKMASMKYELLVEVPQGSTFSIASFNHMGDSLCKPFDVKGPSGSPWSSGCVAFGIDRWVFALLSEYGPFEEWPLAVRERLEGERMIPVLKRSE